MASIINVSHLELRRNLGILGISLPFILVIGNGFKIESSLSAFYYTNMSVYFTGVLFAFGMFLYSYKGYEKKDEKISDNFITNVAGVLAIITALIPGTCNFIDCCFANWHKSGLWGGIHFGSAAIFLVITSWMSFFRFTKGKEDTSTVDEAALKLKSRRNRIYRACGIGIFAALIYLGIVFQFKVNVTGVDIFVGEAIALLFFGSSWLVKSKALKRIGL